MDFIVEVEKILQQRKSSIDYSQKKLDTNTSIDNRLKTIDRVLDSYSSLVPDAYRAWHVNQIKRLGLNKYIELAEKALKYGRNPQALLASMLKNY